jgi:hypothetical protein
MKEDLIADIWNVMSEHIPEKHKKDVAADFVNTLMDYGIKETILDNLLGIDPYLDQAIEYSLDGESYEEDDDIDYSEDEE